MATIVNRELVQDLLEANVQLVDVLPPKQYGESHLPGAINIPLARLTRETADRLRSDRPVIVYCYDFQ